MLISTATSVATTGGSQEDLLVQGLRAGDEQAAESFVSAYADRLLRVATLILGDAHLAEDMVQESLLAAVEHIESFRGDSSLYTWLYTILTRRCRRQQRKKSWNLLRLLPESTRQPPWDIIEDERPSAHEQAEQKQLRQQVLHGMQQLPPRHREVMALFYYEELTVEEIAAVIGKPTGTIKSWLHRGRNKLAGILAEEVQT